MKIKQASLLAIIGVILQLITAITWYLVNTNVLEYGNWLQHSQIISIIGTLLLLPFFISIYNNQKKS